MLSKELIWEEVASLHKNGMNIEWPCTSKYCKVPCYLWRGATEIRHIQKHEEKKVDILHRGALFPLSGTGLHCAPCDDLCPTWTEDGDASVHCFSFLFV